MNYIYTVKPLKEAIKIAAADDQFEINDAGKINIYGIDGDIWPAGEKIESSERITDFCIRKVGKYGFSVPLKYFTVEEKVPEFIKGLYEAVTASCDSVSCSQCPLDALTPGRCEFIGKWLKKRYPEL